MAGDTGTPPPLTRAPSRKNTTQKNLSRHVSFSEDCLKQPQKYIIADTEATPQDRRCNFHGNMCCAWASLIIGTIIVVALVTGVAFYSFIASNLPEFHIHRLDMRRLDVVASEKDTLLTVDVEIHLNATNKNDNIALLYSPMTGYVSSEDLNLGTIHIPAISQKPHNSTELTIRTGVTKAPVDKWDAKDLKSNSKEHQMVITVVLKGTLNLLVNGQRVNGFPFKVQCQDIDQADIDNGFAPECVVKISPFSS